LGGPGGIELPCKSFSIVLISYPQHLLLAQAAAESQRKGKPGQLVDPRPETVEGGEIKIRITPQLVHDIFDEYPVVATAYNDVVPSKVCNITLDLNLYVDLRSKALRRRVLEAIFSIKTLQRASCFHSIFGCPARCQR
jgi:hypothetical protein